MRVGFADSLGEYCVLFLLRLHRLLPYTSIGAPTSIMNIEAARAAKGMSPSQALADSINNAFKSGAVVVFVQGVPGLNGGEGTMSPSFLSCCVVAEWLLLFHDLFPSVGTREASAEVQTMLRNGSTTVYITGGV